MNITVSLTSRVLVGLAQYLRTELRSTRDLGRYKRPDEVWLYCCC
jgi:hypothetical protein